MLNLLIGLEILNHKMMDDEESSYYYNSTGDEDDDIQVPLKKYAVKI